MIKTLTRCFGNEFEQGANDLIKQGYELKSSFCGLEHFYDGSTEKIYMGIFEKKEEV